MNVNANLDTSTNVNLDFLYSTVVKIKSDYRIFLRNDELEIQCLYEFRQGSKI